MWRSGPVEVEEENLVGMVRVWRRVKGGVRDQMIEIKEEDGGKGRTSKTTKDVTFIE